MTTATSTSDLHADHERYEDFLASLRARFAALTTPGAPLFTTDAEGLFSAFLGALPLERRQHYNCRSCRRFVTEYGGLVTIEPNGDMAPAMWDPLNAPPFFEPAVRAVRHIVNRAKVTGVFLSSDETLGLASNQDPGRPVAREDLPAKPPGEWFHMAVARPKALCFKHPTLTAGQVMAEKREEHGMLCRGLAEFSVDVVRQAHTLLSNGQLYRSEKCIDAAKWLLDLHEARRATKNRAICDNVTWRAVATAPAGYCHVRTTMIGTLLEDIAAELGFANIKRRFDEKMSPTAYQRPTAAPTSGAIAEAEKVIATLSAAGSLERRFARLDEIETLWTPAPTKAEAAPSGGVFAHLKPKAPAATHLDTPPVTMTWEKFARTVLPDAEAIEFYVPRAHAAYVALVTAANPDAPPILQWDSEEKRNPVSLYVYTSGSAPADWNLDPDAWRVVNAVTLKPSMWHAPEKFAHQGAGVIFILNGARDLRSAHSGAALFPENLRAELHGIRKTIEAYSRGATIAGSEEASACGIVFSNGSGVWSRNQFRVTSKAGRTVYNLDRWD